MQLIPLARPGGGRRWGAAALGKARAGRVSSYGAFVLPASASSSWKRRGVELERRRTAPGRADLLLLRMGSGTRGPREHPELWARRCTRQRGRGVGTGQRRKSVPGTGTGPGMRHGGAPTTEGQVNLQLHVNRGPVALEPFCSSGLWNRTFCTTGCSDCNLCLC